MVVHGGRGVDDSRVRSGAAGCRAGVDVVKNALYFGGLAVAIFFVGAVVFRALSDRGYDPIATVAGVFRPAPPAEGPSTTGAP
jgi:hypothetical protein